MWHMARLFTGYPPLTMRSNRTVARERLLPFSRVNLINVTMQHRHLPCYTRVNTGFSYIFPDLMGGGSWHKTQSDVAWKLRRHNHSASQRLNWRHLAKADLKSVRNRLSQVWRPSELVTLLRMHRTLYNLLTPRATYNFSHFVKLDLLGKRKTNSTVRQSTTGNSIFNREINAWHFQRKFLDVVKKTKKPKIYYKK